MSPRTFRNISDKVMLIIILLRWKLNCNPLQNICKIVELQPHKTIFNPFTTRETELNQLAETECASWLTSDLRIGKAQNLVQI